MIWIIALVWVHWFADFALQSDRVALNKSKSNLVLAQHVAIYSIGLLPFGVRFALLNYALHFCTDYVSSRVTSRLWAAEKRHWFFVVIGLDQAIHITCLLATWEWLR